MFYYMCTQCNGYTYTIAYVYIIVNTGIKNYSLKIPVLAPDNFFCKTSKYASTFLFLVDQKIARYTTLSVVAGNFALAQLLHYRTKLGMILTIGIHR